MIMSQYGVTIHPIQLQFGATSMSPVTAVTGGGGGGGGGGWGAGVFALPLVAGLLAPLLLAGGGSQAPTAIAPPPPIVAGAVAPGAGPAAGAGGAAVLPVTGPARTAAVVLPQGPTRHAAVVAQRPGRPPLPFTGEDFRLPVYGGLQLIVLGAVLRYGLWSFDRGRRRSRA